MQKNIDSYEIVSFDIFDTLIKRCVYNPHQVFDLVENYCIQNSIKVPNGFRQKRIDAERSVNIRNNRPSTVKEIYQFFCEKNGGDPEVLEKIEKKIELCICKPNPRVLKLFQKCIENKKNVYIISDMYLDASFLDAVLENCGIKGYKKLYVSCEYGITKTTGELFEVVMKENGLNPKTWLHIGDNPRGDIKAPSILGIQTFKIDMEKEKIYPIKAEIRNRLDFNIVNRCSDILYGDLQESEYLGAKVLGPLLVGFSKWLTEMLRMRDISKVYFLARDGYTMKKAFECMNGHEFETFYIYASRRSWTVPAIWLNPEYEEILKNISMPPKTTVRIFITRIGLVPEEYMDEVISCGMTMDSIIDKKGLLDSNDFKKLYNLLKERVIKNSKEEYVALVSYLKKENIQGKIGVVDIGYNGTMQKALQMILDSAGIEVSIHGFYVGLNPYSKLIQNKEIQAISFLYGPNYSNNYQTKVDAFRSVFESMFLAQHGSVYRFISKEGEGVPELYDYEYNSTEERYTYEMETIKEFQSGALSFAEQISQMVKEKIITIDRNIAINNLLYVGLKPDIKAVKLFSDFRMFDTKTFYIAHPDKLINYVMHPNKLKRDFVESTWKIAFMYKVIHLPIPYEKIYYVLKKML